MRPPMRRGIPGQSFISANQISSGYGLPDIRNHALLNHQQCLKCKESICIMAHIIGLYYSLYFVLSTYTVYYTTYYSTIPCIIYHALLNYTLYHTSRYSIILCIIPRIVKLNNVLHDLVFNYNMYYTMHH